MASFLSLPPEVRAQVFQYAMPNDGTYVNYGMHSVDGYPQAPDGDAQQSFPQPRWRRVSSGRFPPSCSWVFSCRAFVEEAMPVLYRSLRFDFAGMTPNYLILGFSSLSVRYRDSVQHVSIGKLWMVPPSPSITGLRSRSGKWSKIGPSDHEIRLIENGKIGLRDSVNFLLDHFPNMVDLDIDSAVYWLPVGDHDRRPDLVSSAV